MQHSKILSNGNEYSFHHLQPYRVTLDGLAVRSAFSSHVYSKSCPEAPKESTFNDENGKLREFCTIRHHQSATLKDVCCGIIHDNKLSWISSDFNNINNMATSEEPLLNGSHYVIIFALYPSRRKNTDVEMIIRSAYPKFVNFKKVKRTPIRSLIKKCHYENVEVPKNKSK